MWTAPSVIRLRRSPSSHIDVGKGAVHLITNGLEHLQQAVDPSACLVQLNALNGPVGSKGIHLPEIEVKSANDIEQAFAEHQGPAEAPAFL
jgi:hypothetical protein